MGPFSGLIKNKLIGIVIFNAVLINGARGNFNPVFFALITRRNDSDNRVFIIAISV